MKDKTSFNLATLTKRVWSIAAVAGLLFAGTAYGADYPLFAGQNIEVGNVEVTDDGTYLTVKYVIDDPNWCLTQTHLAVEISPEEIPQTKKGNPKIGHFPYGDDDLGCVDEWVSDPIAIPGNPAYIAAHAVVWTRCDSVYGIDMSNGPQSCDYETETAWGDGFDFTGNNWGMYFEYTIQERTASLGDRVWNDLNRDGLQDDGEPGIPDVTVKLLECDDQGNPVTDTKRTETTDADGFYVFENLTEGSYAVRFPVDAMTNADWMSSPQNQGNDDAIDSDAEPTTGFTDCVDLGEADENLDLDAGFFKSVYCSDMAPITSLTMVWGGPDNVTMTTNFGQLIIGVDVGDEVVFSTSNSTGDDMVVTLSVGVEGASKFHLDCSDEEMDGPEDCGKLQGNGKDDDYSLTNNFYFEGMTGQNGSLQCTP